ncbi:thioredoxin domain-containing protein [Rhodococcus ruber]|uniref:Thioredoxin domain-containing protein n=1 Tax=Rhodococcus ruber TaxID=1830 RepID=A0ABT4MN34_9NOCA|nr:thioredoxin domain-containing protein [Rhodococcus ruber]MCZ4521740.1 thioredoxin domain-containing protein [Rhodococcus ruber]
MPKTARTQLNTLAAAEHRRSIWVRIGVTAALVAFALIVGIIVIASRDSSTQTAAEPTSVTETGALRAASPNVELAEGARSPKRVLTIYEDFQCPVCKNFEATFGSNLDELRTSGIAAIDYHPIAILDRMSSTDYSTRAANASLCVADSSIDTWLGFHSAAYEQQPAEGGSGLTDEELTDMAVAAGAPDTVQDCITGGHYADWVGDSTRSVLETNINATPTVLLNGEPLDLSTPAALDAAVRAIP